MSFLIVGIFSYWFVLSGIPFYVSNVLYNFGIKTEIQEGVYVPIRLKPVDCEKCLAFWIGIFYFWNLPWYDNLIYAGVCSFVAIVTGLLINKLR